MNVQDREKFFEEFNNGLHRLGKISLIAGLIVLMAVPFAFGVIVGVMPETPAKEAGVRAGDIIVKVDDLIVTEKTYYEAADEIKGEEGTIVNLTVKRNDEEIIHSITRAQIQSSDISSAVIEDDIGYIKIFSFERNVYKNFKAEYNRLINEDEIKGLIINSGGNEYVITANKK